MKINTKLVVPVVLVAILFAAAVVVTQAGSPSSKTAIAGNTIEISYQNNGSYNEVELANATIKTANFKDLIISVTAECGLFTDTKLTGKGVKDLDDEDIATIQVWVVIDNGTDKERTAFPGKVTFAERIQTMKGRLSEMIWDGEEWNNTPEYIELALDTTNANGFNFIVLDMKPGDHTIHVFASVELDESSTSGEVSLDPAGAIGKRTVVIQEVRLVKDTTLPE